MKVSFVKRSLVLLFLLLTLAAFAAAQQITLLHVNDTHSHLDAWGPKDANMDGTLGGLAKASTVIMSEKVADPQALFVHAGDLIHGDPFFNQYLGVPELQMLQGLGITAMAVGNHEFQYGPAFLSAVLNAAGTTFPLVSSNLDLTGYPVLGNWVVPTFLTQANGVKVGFFGITTPFDAIEQPSPVKIHQDIFGDAGTAVSQLRGAGAQVVVCLCHIGMDYSTAMAQAVPGIDVIVNAHDHVAISQPKMVGNTIIVSAGEYYRWVGKLRVKFDGTKVSLVDYSLLGVDANTPAVPEMKATVDYLKQGIVAQYGDIYHTQIATAPAPISKEFDPNHIKRDTALGNLVADAYRAWTGTDMSLEVAGFINESLPSGPIVGADVFRSMSYAMPVVQGTNITMQPFRLATFRMAGAELIKGLEIALTNPDMYPQISGLRFEMDSRRALGSQILLDTVHINGKKIVMDRLYTVTATEGLVYFLPKLGVTIQDVNILNDSAYGAIKALVSERAVLDPDASARIRDVAAIPGQNKKK